MSGWNGGRGSGVYCWLQWPLEMSSRIHATHNRALLLHHMPGYPPAGKTAVTFHHLKSFFDVPTAVCIQLRLRQPTCLCVLHSPGCPWSGISYLRVHDCSHPCSRTGSLQVQELVWPCVGGWVPEPTTRTGSGAPEELVLEQH